MEWLHGLKGMDAETLRDEIAMMGADNVTPPPFDDSTLLGEDRDVLLRYLLEDAAAIRIALDCTSQQYLDTMIHLVREVRHALRWRGGLNLCFSERPFRFVVMPDGREVLLNIRFLLHPVHCRAWEMAAFMVTGFCCGVAICMHPSTPNDWPPSSSIESHNSNNNNDRDYQANMAANLIAKAFISIPIVRTMAADLPPAVVIRSTSSARHRSEGDEYLSGLIGGRRRREEDVDDDMHASCHIKMERMPKRVKTDPYEDDTDDFNLLSLPVPDRGNTADTPILIDGL